MEDEFPKEQSVRTNSEIAYYQWVSLLLALQMLACYLPKVFFDALNFDTSKLLVLYRNELFAILGFTVENLVSVANKITKTKENIFSFNENSSEETNKLIRVIGKNFSHRCTLVKTGKLNKLRQLIMC
jgi:hypothetical protein